MVTVQMVEIFLFKFFDAIDAFKMRIISLNGRTSNYEPHLTYT